MAFTLTTVTLGLILFVAVIVLIRRDRLHISHALFWLLYGVGGLLFGLFPSLSDTIARHVGVSYGPTLILVIALILLVLRSLSADILSTRLERDLKVLTQELALIKEVRSRGDLNSNSLRDK